MRPRGILVALGLALVGCGPMGSGGGATSPAASSAPPARHDGRYLLAWEGAKASDLEQSLGRPEAVSKLASGETILTYRWSQTQTYGGYAVANGGYSQLGTQYVPTQVVSLNCRARFTIGIDGKVRSVDLFGNGCMDQHR